MHIAFEPYIRRRDAREGSRASGCGNCFLVCVDEALARLGGRKGAGQWERRVSLPAGGVRNVGIYMKTIIALLKDRAGASLTKLALMIGLSSSAVLVLVRIGLAAAGQ
jgi:hypothetical protein